MCTIWRKTDSWLAKLRRCKPKLVHHSFIIFNECCCSFAHTRELYRDHIVACTFSTHCCLYVCICVYPFLSYTCCCWFIWNVFDVFVVCIVYTFLQFRLFSWLKTKHISIRLNYTVLTINGLSINVRLNFP